MADIPHFAIVMPFMLSTTIPTVKHTGSLLCDKFTIGGYKVKINIVGTGSKDTTSTIKRTSTNDTYCKCQNLQKREHP